MSLGLSMVDRQFPSLVTKMFALTVVDSSDDPLRYDLQKLEAQPVAGPVMIGSDALCLH